MIINWFNSGLQLCVSCCIDATAVEMSAGFPLNSHTLTSLFRSRAPTGISPCFCVAHKASAPSHGNLLQRPAANEVLKLFKILLRRGCHPVISCKRNTMRVMQGGNWAGTRCLVPTKCKTEEFYHWLGSQCLRRWQVNSTWVDRPVRHL